MEDAHREEVKKLITSISEELFGDDKVKTNKQTSRLMLFLGLVFRKVPPEMQHMFASGPLINLINQLRLETRNYLEAKRK